MKGSSSLKEYNVIQKAGRERIMGHSRSQAKIRNCRIRYEWDDEHLVWSIVYEMFMEHGVAKSLSKKKFGIPLGISDDMIMEPPYHDYETPCSICQMIMESV